MPNRERDEPPSDEGKSKPDPNSLRLREHRLKHCPDEVYSQDEIDCLVIAEDAT